MYRVALSKLAAAPVSAALNTSTSQTTASIASELGCSGNGFARQVLHHSELNRLAPLVQHAQVAHYSADKRPSFFGNILRNLKEEYSKNTEMQESLKKFREEAKKLEESEALKEARRKFESIEGTASKADSSVFKEHMKGVADKVKGTIDEVSRTDAAKKATEFSSVVGKRAEEAAKVVGGAAESIGKSGAFQAASQSAATIKQEIEGSSLGAKVYMAPRELRKRKEYVRGGGEEEVIEANPDATGVELHKDSRFYATWQSFKDSNPVVNKFVDMRVKYEESDNPVVRGARIVTDKVQDIFGGLFTRSELSEVLTEITKMDPNFCKEQFLKDCERDIIPNILEAMIRGDLEILQDWCYEAPFNILATPIRQAQQMGYLFDSCVLDIGDLDLAMGKMMDQGPVLVVTFNAQQILCLRDKSGKVVEGDPEKVMRTSYVWVLCRDQAELDPKAAWRLLELSASSQEQFL